MSEALRPRELGPHVKAAEGCGNRVAVMSVGGSLLDAGFDPCADGTSSDGIPSLIQAAQDLQFENRMDSVRPYLAENRLLDCDVKSPSGLRLLHAYLATE